jgi:hypothetical protein
VSLPADLWWHACRRLLHEAGRARAHDLRDGLNVASLAAELLADPSTRDRGLSEASTRAGVSIRRGIGVADQEVAGLQTLILEVTEPHAVTWSAATSWALAAASPIARRRGLEVNHRGDVDDLEPLLVPAGLSVVFGALLVVIYLDAPRRSAVLVEVRADPEACVALSWTQDVNDPAPVAQACRILSVMLDQRGRAEWRREAPGRLLECAVRRAAGPRAAAAEERIE